VDGPLYALLLSSRRECRRQRSRRHHHLDGTDAGRAEEVGGGEITATAVRPSPLNRSPPERAANAIIASALDRYGRIDLLVHNAGRFAGRR